MVEYKHWDGVALRVNVRVPLQKFLKEKNISLDEFTAPFIKKQIELLLVKEKKFPRPSSSWPIGTSSKVVDWTYDDYVEYCKDELEIMLSKFKHKRKDYDKDHKETETVFFEAVREKIWKTWAFAKQAVDEYEKELSGEPASKKIIEYVRKYVIVEHKHEPTPIDGETIASELLAIGNDEGKFQQFEVKIEEVGTGIQEEFKTPEKVLKIINDYVEYMQEVLDQEFSEFKEKFVKEYKKKHEKKNNVDELAEFNAEQDFIRKFLYSRLASEKGFLMNNVSCFIHEVSKDDVLFLKLQKHFISEYNEPDKEVLSDDDAVKVVRSFQSDMLSVDSEFNSKHLGFISLVDGTEGLLKNYNNWIISTVLGKLFGEKFKGKKEELTLSALSEFLNDPAVWKENGVTKAALDTFLEEKSSHIKTLSPIVIIQNILLDFYKRYPKFDPLTIDKFEEEIKVQLEINDSREIKNKELLSIKDLDLRDLLKEYTELNFEELITEWKKYSDGIKSELEDGVVTPEDYENLLEKTVKNFLRGGNGIYTKGSHIEGYQMQGYTKDTLDAAAAVLEQQVKDYKERAKQKRDNGGVFNSVKDVKDTFAEAAINRASQLTELAKDGWEYLGKNKWKVAGVLAATFAALLIARTVKSRKNSANINNTIETIEKAAGISSASATATAVSSTYPSIPSDKPKERFKESLKSPSGAPPPKESRQDLRLGPELEGSYVYVWWLLDSKEDGEKLMSDPKLYPTNMGNFSPRTVSHHLSPNAVSSLSGSKNGVVKGQFLGYAEIAKLNSKFSCNLGKVEHLDGKFLALGAAFVESAHSSVKSGKKIDFSLDNLSWMWDIKSDSLIGNHISPNDTKPERRFTKSMEQVYKEEKELKSKISIEEASLHEGSKLFKEMYESTLHFRVHMNELIRNKKLFTEHETLLIFLGHLSAYAKEAQNRSISKKDLDKFVKTIKKDLKSELDKLDDITDDKDKLASALCRRAGLPTEDNYLAVCKIFAEAIEDYEDHGKLREKAIEDLETAIKNHSTSLNAFESIDNVTKRATKALNDGKPINEVVSSFYAELGESLVLFEGYNNAVIKIHDALERIMIPYGLTSLARPGTDGKSGLLKAIITTSAVEFASEDSKEVKAEMIEQLFAKFLRKLKEQDKNHN